MKCLREQVLLVSTPAVHIFLGLHSEGIKLRTPIFVPPNTREGVRRVAPFANAKRL